MSTMRKVGIGAGSAGVIAAAVAFLPGWEGMDKVAKVDRIGTGHPITYCYGQTDEFGTVKVGTKFTKQQCDALLAKSLPKYLAKIEPCVKVPVPDKTMAALLDAAYNAGPAAVCNSPMVRKINAGDLRGGCNAFAGWYVRSDGVVRKGLVARRAGDSRKGEKQLCLEGLAEEPDLIHRAPAAPKSVKRAAVVPPSPPNPRCEFPWLSSACFAKGHR